MAQVLGACSDHDLGYWELFDSYQVLALENINGNKTISDASTLPKTPSSKCLNSQSGESLFMNPYRPNSRLGIMTGPYLVGGLNPPSP